MSTILVVDDSSTDRKLATGLLQRQADWSVAVCENGREAVASMNAALPDVIVTDLQMPEMDGLELVREVKEEWPFIPVILLTAQGSEEIAVEALRSGAASYVPKRRLGVELVETVRRILNALDADVVGQRLQHYLVSSNQSFKLLNDLEQISRLTQYVQQQLRCLPLGDEIERLRVSLAFEEALKNACLHGNLEMEEPSSLDRGKLLKTLHQRAACAPYSQRRIRVELQVNRFQAVFTVSDEGRGFDHAQLLKSAVLDDQEAASHRGLALIRTIFDDVTFNESGSEVTLIKHGIRPEELQEEPEELLEEET